MDEHRPGRLGKVIRSNPKTGARSLDELQWGLLPHNTRNPDSAPQPIFARAETVATNDLFADAFRSRRCLVVATSYPQRASNGSQSGKRFVISRADGDPMAWAGLWETYRWPDGHLTRTYCVITVEANGLLAPIHDRMPCGLEKADWPVWLGEEEGDPLSLLRPAAEGVLISRPPIVRANQRRSTMVPRGPRQGNLLG
jgi:putative SOS response-associated peptidase YedK